MLFPQGGAPGSKATLTTNFMKRAALPYSMAADSIFT